jgi:DNA-directed RNA polymerase alpha subunit
LILSRSYFERIGMMKLSLHASGSVRQIEDFVEKLNDVLGSGPVEVEVEIPEQEVQLGGELSLSAQIDAQRFQLDGLRIVRISDALSSEPKIAPDDLSQMEIEELELRVRAYNRLKSAGIHTAADVVARSETELLSLFYGNRGLLEEVKRILGSYGLELRVPSEAEEALDTMLVEDLELGVRAYGNLKRSGIQTVGELVRKTPEEIRALRGIGPDSEEQIRATLHSRGLYLVGDGPPTGPLELPDGVEPSIKVGGIGLVPRTSNLLKRANINTLGDLLTSSWQELGELPGFGPGSEKEVREALQRQHASLGLKTKKA